MSDETATNAVSPAGDADNGGDPADVQSADNGGVPADVQSADNGGVPADVQSAGESPASGSEIHDPAAYYKSQAEKLERLLRKEVETRTALEQQARLDAERSKAVADAGLPSALARFLTGEDAETIAAQVEELSGLITPAKPKAAERARTANPGDGAGSDLTIEKVKSMTTQEYMTRRDEVQAFLKRQQSK